jgi:hypothetical protein
MGSYTVTDARKDAMQEYLASHPGGARILAEVCVAILPYTTHMQMVMDLGMQAALKTEVDEKPASQPISGALRQLLWQHIQATPDGPYLVAEATLRLAPDTHIKKLADHLQLQVEVDRILAAQKSNQSAAAAAGGGGGGEDPGSAKEQPINHTKMSKKIKKTDVDLAALQINYRHLYQVAKALAVALRQIGPQTQQQESTLKDFKKIVNPEK